MKSNIASKDEKENIEKRMTNINLGNLKSDYFMQKIYNFMNKKKSLEIVKYNKKIQNRLNLSINDYKEYSEIYTPIVI